MSCCPQIKNGEDRHDHRCESRTRIFDHLTGREPEAHMLNNAAWCLYDSAWWDQVPTYRAPPSVSGEIDADRIVRKRLPHT